MKTQLYRFDDKFEKPFPIEHLAFDHANEYHDDRVAGLEKKIGDKWWVATALSTGGCAWSDGIYLITTEVSTDREFKIVEVFNKLKWAKDDAARKNKFGSEEDVEVASLVHQLDCLLEEREKFLQRVDYDLGFEITHENQDTIIHILKLLQSQYQLDVPLFVMAGKLSFRGGPFMKVDRCTAKVVTEAFHTLAKQYKLV